MCWMAEESEQKFLEQCYPSDEAVEQRAAMFIPATNTYATAKARNADYTAFMEALGGCQNMADVAHLKAEFVDMFSRLRNEKQEGFDTWGYDYLGKLKQAIEVITNKLKENENVY